MSNTIRYCFSCEQPKGETQSGLRCANCARQARKKVVRRKSEPPTPQATPCRVWQGPVNYAGYGQNGRYGRVHRWVWESAHGPIPEGMVVMHLCDNRPCFRLDHLKLGTQAENNADRKRKGRNAVAPKNPTWLAKRGENHAQAKLTEDQVAGIKALARDGLKDHTIAEMYGVSRSHINNIRLGKVWEWVQPAQAGLC